MKGSDSADNIVEFISQARRDLLYFFKRMQSINDLFSKLLSHQKRNALTIQNDCKPFSSIFQLHEEYAEMK